MKYKIILALFVAFSFLGCKKDLTKVTSSDMIPTITPGELFFIDSEAYENSLPKRWDIVAFKFPDGRIRGIKGRVYVKRIIGLPEEKIEFKNSKLYINGTAVPIPKSLSFLKMNPTLNDSRINKNRYLVYPFNIPKDQYFVFADNPKGGLDSRLHGTVLKSEIIGEVIIKY